MTELDHRDPVTEDAEPPAPRRPTGRPALPAVALLAVAGLVVLGLIASSAWMLVQAGRERAEQSRDDAVLAVARQTVVNILSVDPGSTAAALQRLRDTATGEFEQQLVAQADSFRTVIGDNRVTATGTVSEAGVRTADDTSATVLVSAVGEVKNTAAPEGEPRQYRMVLQLRNDGMRWLVAKLDFVP